MTQKKKAAEWMESCFLGLKQFCFIVNWPQDKYQFSATIENLSESCTITDTAYESEIMKIKVGQQQFRNENTPRHSQTTFAVF